MLEDILKEAKTTKSDNPIVHILWLAQGVDIYNRTDGQRGHSLDNAQKYIASQLLNNFMTKAQIIEVAKTFDRKTCSHILYDLGLEDIDNE